MGLMFFRTFSPLALLNYKVMEMQTHCKQKRIYAVIYSATSYTVMMSHLWYNCRALAVTAIAVHRTIATAIVRRLDYG